MTVLDVPTWSRGDVLSLRLTDRDIGLLRGWIITLKTLIGLIKYSSYY
jgi:hypothetical protein